MREIETVLIVVSQNLTQQGSSRVLVSNTQDELALPVVKPREQESTHDAACRLLLELTGLKARVNGVGWVELRQYPLVESVLRVEKKQHPSGGDHWMETVRLLRSAVAVPYGAIVPGDVTKSTDGFSWVRFSDAFAAPFVDDHKDILHGVLARV